MVGPNESKLSDGGWRRKAWIAEEAPPPASVRWSALLGAWNSESAERGHTSGRRGNDGRCRRERLTEMDDDPRKANRDDGANGNRRGSRNERGQT